MNGFQKAEHKGRQLFQSFLDQVGATGQPTEEDYDTVDYYFQVKDKKCVAEIKVRNAYYDDYMIEVGKLQALEKKKKEQDLDGAFYICFFGNSMYVFTTSIIKQYGTVTKKWCKRHSVYYDGYRLKDVVLVPTNKATVFNKIDGIWTK